MLNNIIAGRQTEGLINLTQVVMAFLPFVTAMRQAIIDRQIVYKDMHFNNEIRTTDYSFLLIISYI